MKNICIFINTLLKGGAEKQAVLLAKALNSQYNVWLIVFQGDMKENHFIEIIDKDHIQTIYLNGSFFTKCILFYKFLKTESIDIIFSYLLTTNIVAGIIGRLANVKFIIGGIRNSKFSGKKLLLQRIIHNYITHYTIYNNYRGFYSLKLKGFNSQKALVIPNCFILTTKQIIRHKNNSIIILSVGRFTEQKDYFTALKSINEIRKKYKNIYYYIVGYGSLERQLYKWIRELNISNFVEIVINPHNLEDYYLKSDIYLMTSIFEGMSNSVLEAMSFSLPIVATDVGDNKCLVYDNVNGYISDARDYKQIANNLCRLIISYEKRISFGIESYRIVKENYSFEAFQKRYVGFIENLK